MSVTRAPGGSVAERGSALGAIRRTRADEHLEQLAHAASHDLQEPLTTIAGYLELVERRYGAALDDDGVRFLGYATAGARRMRQMLDGLVALARVTTKGAVFARADLGEVLDEATARLAHRLAESNAVVRHAALPVAYVDRAQLAQLFSSLVDNALKFRGVAAPLVDVSGASRSDGSVEVMVRDNGVGFERRHKERIFGVFQRLCGEEVEGIGIGLALCRAIVERHGGEISADGRPGEGAVFHFTLPARPG